MLKKALILPALVPLLCGPVWSVDLGGGLFGSAQCKAALLEIAHKWGTEFQNHADRLGLAGQRRNEYLHRRIREKYLKMRYEQAALEFTYAEDLVGLVAKTAEPGTGRLPRGNRLDSLVNAKRTLKDPADGKSGEQTIPALFQLYDSRPPRFIQDIIALTDLLELRSYLAMRRARYSTHLVNLPLDTPVSKLPAQEWARVRLAVEESLGKDLVSIRGPSVSAEAYRKHLFETDFTKADPAEDARMQVKLHTLKSNLLNSADVPRVIRDEIAAEADFARRSRLGPYHYLFREFLLRVSSYLGIE